MCGYCDIPADLFSAELLLMRTFAKWLNIDW